MQQLTIEQARRNWSAAQGLDAPRDETISETVARTGWVRTLGGIAGYLALSARNPQATVEAVRAALAAEQVRVSPAVRGCIYLVPDTQAALALRVAHHLSAKRIRKEQDKLAVSDEELDQVGAAVLAAVADQPLTTAQVRKALSQGTVRSLGDAGKKMGVTSTLPPALRRLEFAGRLARVPVDARLDLERYAWKPAKLAVGDYTPDDAVALAQLYLQWAGPSTRKEFAAWSGLSQTEAKAALAQLAPATTILADDEVFGPSKAAAATGAVHWLPGMDNLYGLRLSARHLVDSAHAEVPVTHFGGSPRSTLSKMSQPIERTIVRDGQVVGMWAWDPAAASFVTSLPAELAGELAAGNEAEAQRVRAIIDTVGHGKVFSIDSDARLQLRADRLRNVSWP